MCLSPLEDLSLKNILITDLSYTCLPQGKKIENILQPGHLK